MIIKKKAVKKNFFMELRQSKSRFISIMFIVALGVSFFSGIKASEPDMRFSLDSYYDRTKLFDVRVQGLLGLTDGDLSAITALPGVEYAEAAKTADVLYDLDSSQKVMHFISLYDSINIPELTQGTLPSKKNECAIDASFAEKAGIRPGDTITVYVEKNDDSTDINDIFNDSSFTVTGLVSSSMYSSFTRGSSLIGQGEVNAFVFVPESAFVSDVYTQIDISASGAADKIAYTDGYNSIVSELMDTVEGIQDERCSVRYDETIGDAQQKVDDAKKELQDNIDELDKNSQKLDDSQAELDKAASELSDGQKKYDSAKATAEKQLSAAYKKLEASQSELDNQKAQLDVLKSMIDAGNTAYQAQYDSGMVQLTAAQSQLNAGFDEYSEQKKSTYAKLDASRQKLDDSKKEIAKAQATIEENRIKISDGRTEIENAKIEISDNQKKIDDMDSPEWYITDRDDLPQYTQCGDNAGSVGAIGNVFPVIFFLVAALISLTTMTRMVEEERSQIGIFSALGYSKLTIIGKFMWYCILATLSGCIIGVLAGEKIFPFVIIYSYQIMTPYATDIVIPYQLSFGLAASAAAICCTMLATLFACHRELTSTPAALMRPVSPRNGKRILMERFTFLWKRLSFSDKSTFRNIFRYKRRLLMTVLGIGGCMSLMLVGFGIKDSIEEIADLQYKDIQLYQGMIIHNAADSAAEIDSYLDTCADTSYSSIYFANIDAGTQKSSYSCYLFVPDDTSDLTDFITLRTRKDHESIKLSDSGVVVTEKLSALTGLKAGDTINITRNNKSYPVKISAITENYLYHYIYMSAAYYESVFGSAPEDNAVIYKTGSTDEAVYKKVGEGALSIDNVVNVNYASASRSQLDSMLSSLDTVIVVLVIAAGMLAFVVIYNLNNISINERQRELATLKVLGFFDTEVAMYIYRENILLTLAGCIAGCFIGSFLHRFIIVSVEIDTCMFGRSIAPVSFLYSALLTIVFAVIVNLMMYFKLKQIDMIESLKSAE